MDENEARQWISDGLQWIAKGATLTPTTIDDQAVAIVAKALESDVIWGWAWRLLDGFVDGSTLVESEPVVDEVLAASAEVGIDPLTLVAIVKAIADLVKLFRQ
ncbi:MAG: hypothetical protein GXY58_19485 [Planctomycetaceae bacterium]|nr:hypothetical protein [Planctomycetaceae bacterium]